MAIDRDTSIPNPGRILAQATGVLLPPLAMLAGMEASYAAVPPTCAGGSELTIHAIHLVTLLLIAGAGLLARRQWTGAGADDPGDGGSEAARGRLLGWMGMFTAALFALVVLAQWTAGFFISPCQ